MIKPLRKRHLQVWTLFAFLIPAGVISGYMAIPKPVASGPIGTESLAELPVVINDAETKYYTVYLRSSADRKVFQLKWVNKEGIKQPASLIYMEQGGERELIGRIGGAGVYFFALRADTLKEHKFILYDIIHQQVTDSLIFRQ